MTAPVADTGTSVAVTHALDTRIRSRHAVPWTRGGPGWASLNALALVVDSRRAKC